MVMVIKPAQKVKQFARVCLWGIEKSGKTHGSLELATALVGPSGKIGVISSERGSSSLLARKFPHDIIDLTIDEGNNPVRNPFTPKRYEEALQTFVNAGYDVIIVDSLTHLWEGEGGILEFVQTKGGDFQDGWKAGTPLYQKFLNVMLSVPCHLIVTLRAKESYEMETYTKKNGTQGTRPKNAGSAPVIRKGFGFEMQLMVRMHGHIGEIAASGCEESLPQGTEIASITEELAPALAAWLEGAPPPERVIPLTDSYKRGLVTGAWTKDAFYETVSLALGNIPVSRETSLTPEQLKIVARMAENNIPVASKA